MTMPNITFCISKDQAWSHFRLNKNESIKEWNNQIQKQLLNMKNKKSFLLNDWDFRMVMETFNLISTLTSMERETTVEGSANTIDKFNKQNRFKELQKTLKVYIF